MKKLLLLAIVVLGISAVSFGQDTETATASATILTPISISKLTNMNFGNVAVSGTAGTVILTPAGTRSATGGVTVTDALAGGYEAASFKVDGDNNHTFSITLPTGDHAIKHATTADEMVVKTFTSTPTTSGTLVSGTLTIYVGATLEVGAGQKPGVYTSKTPFDVIVNYN